MKREKEPNPGVNSGEANKESELKPDSLSSSSYRNVIGESIPSSLRKELDDSGINLAEASFIWHTGLVKDKDVEGLKKLLNNPGFNNDFETAKNMRIEEAKKFLRDKYQKESKE